MHHYTHEAAAIQQFSSIEVERQHREHKLELPCKLTQDEVVDAAGKYTTTVREREAQERDRAAEDKRRKGEIESLLGKERLLLRIVETKTEDRPVKVSEFFARLHGEPTIVAVRANRFFGEITEDNYVGHRSPGPMDRQVKVPNTETSASSDVLERQGAAAFASAEPIDGEPQPFDDDNEHDGGSSGYRVIQMEGAAAPESSAPKRSRPPRANGDSKAKAKDKAKDKAKK